MLVKDPPRMTLVASGETTSCRMVPPAGVTANGCTAPVAADTAAAPLRVAPFTEVKIPAK